jgi:cathepsin L
MEVFMASLRKVQEHNAKESSSYKLGINKFSDWTQEERESILSYKPNQAGKEGRLGSFIDFNTTNLNATVDWRPHGWVTPVWDQGKCGSCYAISAVGSLEGQYRNLTGKLVELSVQQVLDCSKSYGNKGCGGGLPDWVYDYIWDNGLETAKDYPYNGGDKYCNDDYRKFAVGIKGYYDVRQQNTTQLKAALNFIGPISIGVGAGNSEWFQYQGGIIDDY